MMKTLESKKYGITLCILWLVSSNLIATQQRPPNESYNYWAQRGIIEMVYAFMDDYINTVDSSKTKEENRNRILYRCKFIDDINKFTPEQIGKKLDSISPFLINNNWGNTEKALLQPLLQNWKSRKILDTYFFNTLNPADNKPSTNISGHTNKLEKWNSTKETILNKYKEELQHNTSPKKEYPWWVIIIAFCSGCAVSYMILRYKFNHKPKHDDVRQKHKQPINNDSTDVLSSNKISDPKTPLLEKEDNYPNNTSPEISTDDHPNSEQPNGDQTINQDTGNIQNKTVLYFNMPETEGYFIREQGKASGDERTFYKIEYMEGEKEGELTFISTSRDAKAINRRESFLQPVCIIENLSAIQPQKINMLTPGRVILEGNYWKIDPLRKIKIKLT